MAIEIVDFPMKNGGSFHSYGTVYQRVTLVYGRYFTNYSYIMVVINHVFFSTNQHYYHHVWGAHPVQVTQFQKHGIWALSEG